MKAATCLLQLVMSACAGRVRARDRARTVSLPPLYSKSALARPVTSVRASLPANYLVRRYPALNFRLLGVVRNLDLQRGKWQPLDEGKPPHLPFASGSRRDLGFLRNLERLGRVRWKVRWRPRFVISLSKRREELSLKLFIFLFDLFQEGKGRRRGGWRKGKERGQGKKCLCEKTTKFSDIMDG